MKQAPTGALDLAALISSLSRDELNDLAGSRRIASPGAVSEFLGLAIELLRPDSIRHALQHLDRDALRALIALAEGEEGLLLRDPDSLARLRLRGLTGLSDAVGTSPAGDTVLPEVAVALAEVDLEDATGDLLRSDDPRPDDVGPVADTSRWFGPAASTVSRAAAMLRALDRHPARLSRRGTVTVSAQRELAEATRDTVEHAATLLHLLRLTHLVEPGSERGAHLHPSARSRHWLEQDHPERWIRLAEWLIAAFSPELRQVLDRTRTAAASGASPSANLRTAATRGLRTEYPLLPATEIDEARSSVDVAEALGLSVEGRLSLPAVKLLAGDRASALATVVQDFPATAPGVYLQPDLSVVVTGPLSPADEAVFARIAELEQVGVASTMRLSSHSLTRALRTGLGVREIRSFLDRITLTGLPQPLDYLLGDLERKHGERQAPQPESARATAKARREGAARSPGEPLQQPVDEIEALVDRVWESRHASPSGGDLARRLELAIRHRATVRVTAAAHAGAPERTYTVLPVSLSRGRLRATDESAGVERTLPLKAIVSVEGI